MIWKSSICKYWLIKSPRVLPQVNVKMIRSKAVRSKLIKPVNWFNFGSFPMCNYFLIKSPKVCANCFWVLFIITNTANFALYSMENNRARISTADDSVLHLYSIINYLIICISLGGIAASEIFMSNKMRRKEIAFMTIQTLEQTR